MRADKKPGVTHQTAARKAFLVVVVVVGVVFSLSLRS